MKVVYDSEQEVYLVELEENENETLINTDDIVEARKYFIENMTRLFNNAVNKQLKD